MTHDAERGKTEVHIRVLRHAVHLKHLRKTGMHILLDMSHELNNNENYGLDHFNE